MGYIFDALARSGKEHNADQPRAARPSLPPLEDLAAASSPECDDLATQLDGLESQVEELSASLADTPPPHPDATAEPMATPHAAPPSIASTGPLARALDERLVVFREPGSIMAEEYRSIRTQLLARCEHKRRLVHTITSATPQEGKTITSVNLGLSFSELRNRSVVVIEADLRLPTFAKLIRFPDRPGMIQYLRGEAALDEIVCGVEGSRMHVIPAGGRCGAEAIQLLSGSRMPELLRELRHRYDHILIDTPPVTDLADAGIVGAVSDEVMLVVRMRRTPQPLVEQAIRTLRGYHAPVAGLIATDQRRARGRGYYRYGYHYGPTTTRAA